jgi:hypothetical protein
MRVGSKEVEDMETMAEAVSSNGVTIMKTRRVSTITRSRHETDPPGAVLQHWNTSRITVRIVPVTIKTGTNEATDRITNPETTNKAVTMAIELDRVQLSPIRAT